eukprot:SAG31_NODE_24253_length_485_cov_1.699482_1_plen_56_part_00
MVQLDFRISHWWHEHEWAEEVDQRQLCHEQDALGGGGELAYRDRARSVDQYQRFN